MSKSSYTPKFRAKVAQEYLDGNCTRKDLSAKYNIPESTIRDWINVYKTHGINAFINTKGHKQYTKEFKIQCVEAVLKGKQIESYVKGTVNGRDICGGFKEDWIRMLDLNELTAPQGAQSQIDSLISRFKNAIVEVSKGNYQGVNPFDANDTIDLNKGYVENKYRSAPSFNYILKDYVIIDNK